MMPMRRWLWLGLVILVLAGGLGAYGLRVLLWPSERPQANPNQLLVQAHIVDDETGLPVRATVFLNGIPTLRDVDHFTIVVPNEAAALPQGFTIEVRADGYEPWGMRFRYKLKQGYLFKGPIRLRRAR